MTQATSPPCPICNHPSALLDVVDFSKSCEEPRGKFLPLSGNPVYYALCDECGFCFAPQIATWSLGQFEERIYNDGYKDIDPDYVDVRPRAQAASLTALFGRHSRSIRHLDYGGGDGLLSALLLDQGFDSCSYDPFVNRTVNIGDIGKFDLISAIEVFEHVPDVNALMGNLRGLLKPDGIVFFTTLTSDGNIQKNQRLTWWYASPRNGHISLFSKKSLATLAGRYGLNFGSFNEGAHLFWRAVPGWASHLIKPGQS